MATSCDRALLLAARGRSLGTGEFVLGRSQLDSLPGLLGLSNKKRITDKMVSQIQLFAKRRGEWDIGCIPALCCLLDSPLPANVSEQFYSECRAIRSATLMAEAPAIVVMPIAAMPTSETIPTAGRMVPADAAVHHYNAMSKPKLVATLGKRDETISELKSTIRQHKIAKTELGKKMVLATKKIENIEDQLAALNQHSSSLQLLASESKAGKRFCMQSVIGIGVRRNFSNIACNDLGSVILNENLSRQKVARCEIVAADLFQGASAQFHKRNEEDLCTPENADGFHITSIAFSADAAGAKFFKGKTISNCRAKTTYHIDAAESVLRPLDELPSQDRLCDILEQEQGDAEATTATLVKHLQSIGAPTWETPPTSTTGKHLRVFLYTSDRGSDQTKARKLIPLWVKLKLPHEFSKLVVFVSTDCWDHASHLVEHDGLKFWDNGLKDLGITWKYYGSLTKGCHGWRANHRQMCADLVKGKDKDKDKDFIKCARSLVPICDAGRWGATNAVLSKIMALGGITVVYRSLKIVLDKHASQADRASKVPKKVDHGTDEIALDSNDQFIRTRNRWAKETLLSWSSPLFAFIASIDLRHNGPVEHLRHYLRKPLTDLNTSQRGQHLARLVSGKLSKIASEYNGFYADGDHVNLLLQQSFEAHDTIAAVQARTLAAHHLHTVCGSFRRRMVDKANDFPLQLMRFADQEPHVRCDIRQPLAARLLDTEEGRLEATARFVRMHFHEELEECKVTGRIGNGLYAFALVMKREWVVTVRQNESINSTLKMALTRSRNMSESLANARCILKYALHKRDPRRLEGGHNEARNQRLLGEAIMGTCLDAIADAATDVGLKQARRSIEQLLHTSGRHTAPLPLADAPADPDIGKPDYFKSIQQAQIPAADLRWGEVYELIWRQIVLDNIGFDLPIAIQLRLAEKEGKHVRYASHWFFGMDKCGYRIQFGHASPLEYDEKSGEASGISTDLPVKSEAACNVFSRFSEQLRSGQMFCTTYRLTYDFNDQNSMRHASIVKSQKCIVELQNKDTKKLNAAEEKRADKQDKHEHKDSDKDKDAAKDKGDVPEVALAIEDVGIEHYLQKLIEEHTDGDVINADLLENLQDVRLSERLAHLAATEKDESQFTLGADAPEESAADVKYVAHCKNAEDELAESLLAAGCHKLMKSAADEHLTPSGLDGADHDECVLKELVLNSEDGLGVFECSPDLGANAAPVVEVDDYGEHVNRLRHICSESFANLWHAQALLGCKAVADRELALMPGPSQKALGTNNELALLEMSGGNLGFVHGMTPECKTGRRADIDKDNGVKDIVCVNEKRTKSDYSDCLIVHPAVGTRMTKDKQEMPDKKRRTVPMYTQRPKLRPETILLQELWRAARGNCCAALCELCGDASLVDAELLQCCWLCNMVTHTKCVQTFLSREDVYHTTDSKPAGEKLNYLEPFTKSVP